MRMVRVATLSLGRSSDFAQTLQQALTAVEQVSASNPDIIALPEAIFNNVATAQSVPGPLTDTFAALARKHRSYIILPLIKKEKGLLFNVALLIDPEGQVVGEYQKMFPTDYEMRDGVIPGKNAPVFTTSFGRIGCAICFDLNFPEVMQELAAGGAELVFFLSAYEGGRQIQRWALDYSVYMVSAHWGGQGVFVDKTGLVIERGDMHYQRALVRDLNLDREIFHLDYNGQKLDALLAKYNADVKIDFFRAEAFFALESRSSAFSVTDLKHEFALETFQEYLARSRQLRQERLP